MRAVSVEKMRKLEHAAMDAGVTEPELMERAGRALGLAIGRQFCNKNAAVAYLGKGHNGGDALIALRVLKEEFGWKIAVRAAFPMDEWAELTRAQWGALDLDGVLESPPGNGFFGRSLLIDGLLGIGAKGPLRKPLVALADEMGDIRRNFGATVIAVDVPSGVDPDSGKSHQGAIVADRTFMIAAPKTGLLSAQAVGAVGGLCLVEVEGLSGGGEGMELISPQSSEYGKEARPFDFHKGKAGRVAIVAGSSAFTGAALISALGAIRAGGGLVTLYVRADACEAIRARLPLEVMLKSCDDPAELLGERCDAIVIGPGLGEMDDGFSKGLRKLINESDVPTVIDADGLNFMSQKGIVPRPGHVLTPHPGEFSRLAPDLEGLSREESIGKFVAENEGVLLLKGARTLVAKRNEITRANSTGTPAMSNGGQGDLLSGVIAALLGGGMDAMDAASLGAWLCGRAAEISERENGSPATATDCASYLGLALCDWRGRSR